MTKYQMEQSKSEYLYAEPTRDGAVVYMDSAKEDCCNGWYVNDPHDDTVVIINVMAKQGG